MPAAAGLPFLSRAATAPALRAIQVGARRRPDQCASSSRAETFGGDIGSS
jgi:hypothetical protein